MADPAPAPEPNKTPDSGPESGPESAAEDLPGTAEDRKFEELWSGLDANEKKCAQQWLFCSSIADAARAVGLDPQTVYNWDNDWREAAELLLDRRKDGIEKGIGALSPHAVEVLRKALTDEEEISRVQKESATYVIDRINGAPTQKQEIETQGGIQLDQTDEAELDKMLGHLDEDEEGEE